MTKRTKQTRTAQEAYAAHRIQIEGLLARIAHQLTIEDAKAELEPKNYGFAGDLEEVESRLQAIADFLPVCKCSRKQNCPACAADKAAGKR
jgi:hypothetical protein